METPGTRSVRASAVALAFVLGTVGPAGRARAEDRDACASAYIQVQVLRKAGRLRAAHDAATACAQDTCAAFISSDCTRWTAEINDDTPSLVLGLPECHQAAPPTVAVDGVEQASVGNGLARPFDPGVHAVDVTSASGRARRSVRLVIGERNKLVAFTERELCGLEPPASAKLDAARSPVPVPPHRSYAAPLAWGASGLALLGAGATLWAVGTADAHTATCNTNPEIGCPREQKNQVAALLIGGDVSMALGLVGVAVGSIVLVRSPASAPIVSLAPGWQSLAMTGSF